MPDTTTSLVVGRRDRGRRGRLLAVLVPLVLVVAAAGFAVYYATSPQQLPTSSSRVALTAASGTPVYVGVFAPPDDFDRTLVLSGVKVHAVSDADLTLVPMLCRDGALGVTTDPAAFCADLVDPEGQSFGEDDSIVLEVSADSAVTATVDPVRLGFREGVQWGTETAGSGVDVNLLGRDGAAADTDADDGDAG